MDTPRTLIFDDDCALCSFWVFFIQKYDRKNRFQLVAQHSRAGQLLLDKYKLSTNSATSVVYIYNYINYSKSTACLHVLKDLNHYTKIFYILMIIPKPIRDVVYDVIAKNRHRFFRKRKTCILHYKQA